MLDQGSRADSARLAPAVPIRISVVSPVFRAEDCVEELHARLVAVLEEMGETFEIVLVDDCSPDGSWKLIEALSARDGRVRGLQLSRNFGQHHAVTAGLAASRGEWVVVMDCDLQDRPEEIPRLFRCAIEEGHLCVMGRRARRRDNPFKRVQSWAFYKLFSYLTEMRYDGAVSNFSIASRQVIDDVLAMGESVRYYPGFLFWLGYTTGFVDVRHDPRFAGETSYSFRKLWKHSQSIILAHSTKPLRVCVGMGFTLSFASVLAGFFYLAWVLYYGSSVTGWASLIISIYFSTGAIIFTLGIVGLYVGRIFTEVKGRPLFVVRRRTYDV